jgi:hypothetical protein
LTFIFEVRAYEVRIAFSREPSENDSNHTIMIQTTRNSDARIIRIANPGAAI